MNAEAAAALRGRLAADPDADLASLRTDTDKVLAIGQDVWRLRWRQRWATAVAEDASLHTTCGALFDAVALLEASTDGDVDRSGVHVLIDRELPDADPTETDQAVRSIRAASRALTIAVWYRDRHGGWVEDRAEPPAWGRDDQRLVGWVRDLLVPRLTTQPEGIAVSIVEAVGDPSLQLYPSQIRRGVPARWALRIDGLEIGVVTNDVAVLQIGSVGDRPDGPQRRAFTEVFGSASVKVTLGSQGGAGVRDVAGAAAGIQMLLRRFRDADIKGAPIMHRERDGARVVDEHAVEARLLKGLIHYQHGVGLVADDHRVARGSQFPTLWAHGGRARYLDALLRRGRTPMAIEVKVAAGGQGRYYRRSLIQAVLYRHFIRSAPALDPWFSAAQLDREHVEAHIALPIPQRWTERFGANLRLLRRVADHFDVGVQVVDDRATPDWVARIGLPEPPLEMQEALSWRLAASLSRGWPQLLGRVVERHDLNGFYDQIELRNVRDRRMDEPSSTPRVRLNRPGSAWVFGQSGEPRWTWREVWSHLAADGDADEAAAIIASVGGLGRAGPHVGLKFAEVASQFLDAVDGSGWTWRCAWPNDGTIPAWVEQYRAVLHAYNRVPSADYIIPTIGRIWGALCNGDAVIIIDQETLRAWTADSGIVHELPRDDVVGAMVAAAQGQR